MTESEIAARIKALDENPGWYQNIDLKNGMTTKTRRVWGERINHPKGRWKSVKPGFPQSFTGKSVLDLGCNAGFFSFVAADRGADRVCGVDHNPGYIEQARFCNDVRGDNVDFRTGGVTPIEVDSNSFDVTLCIGLLYHVVNIMGAIQQISRVTREMAIVESAIFDGHDETPLILVADQKRPLPGTWNPNIAGLRKMFHLAHFARTEVLFKNPTRGAIVAYK